MQQAELAEHAHGSGTSGADVRGESGRVPAEVRAEYGAEAEEEVGGGGIGGPEDSKPQLLYKL